MKNKFKSTIPIFFIASWLLVPLSIDGQSMSRYVFKPYKIAQHSLFLEIGGDAAYYSINYDKIFYVSTDVKFTYRIGVSFNTFTIPKVYEDNWHFSPRIPLALNILIGKNRHHFEVGLGYCPYLYSSNLNFDNSFSAKIGYRYQLSKGGLFLRATYTPFLYDNGLLHSPWFGISIGKSFMKLSKKWH